MERVSKIYIIKYICIFLFLLCNTEIYSDDKIDSLKVDSLKVDSLKVDSLKVDSLKSDETSYNIFPFAFYTPETAFAFGAGGVINFPSSPKPSSLTLSAYYSTRNQFLISLKPELYFDNGKYLLNVGFHFGKTVDEFYGIGNYTEKIDNAEYKYQKFGINSSFQIQLFDEYYLGIIYDFGKVKMLDKKENPYLKSGDITGTDGGFTSGLGFKLTWDIRDNINYPTKGGYHQIKAIYYQKAFGSNFIFNNYSIDLRRYISASEDHIFAFQVYGSYATENTPFYKLPALGGSSLMRGYYEGRFRDKYYFATQVEYRTKLFWKLGLVSFAGIGEVANSLSDYKLSGFKYSFGVGLRYTLDILTKLDVRGDFGIGKKTTGVYFSMGQSF